MFRYLIVLCLIVNTAFAEDLVDNKAPEVKELKEEGWHPKLKYSINFSQQSNDKVIGQQTGDTISLGATIEGGLDFKSGLNELRQDLKIVEATSKTPTVPRYVKSADDFTYNLLYLRSLESYPWLGPYAKASLETNLFKGEDVQTGNVIKLTDAFKPMTTKESVGVFAKLIEEKKQTLEMRLGIGAQQVSADDQLAVDKYDSTTNTLTLKTLKSYSQAGAEFGTDYTYKFDEKSTFKFMAELFQPIDPDLPATDTRSGTELLDSSISASLNTKAYEWLGFSLEAKYMRQPQLQEAEQKQISLLANITQVLID